MCFQINTHFQAMYREKVQLEILDAITNHRGSRITTQILLEKYPDDSTWKQNYQCLHASECILTCANDMLVVTLAGEQRRVELREKFQSQGQICETLRYVKWTFWVALAGLLVAIVGLAATVFQWYQPKETTTSPKPSTEQTAQI